MNNIDHQALWQLRPMARNRVLDARKQQQLTLKMLEQLSKVARASGKTETSMRLVGDAVGYSTRNAADALIVKELRDREQALEAVAALQEKQPPRARRRSERIVDRAKVRTRNKQARKQRKQGR